MTNRSDRHLALGGVARERHPAAGGHGEWQSAARGNGFVGEWQSAAAGDGIVRQWQSAAGGDGIVGERRPADGLAWAGRP